MLDTVLPLQNDYLILNDVKLKPAWALSRNTAWWDAQYAWIDIHTELAQSQWKQYAGSQVTWWTRHLLTCYDQGGIWDWHSDQQIFNISRDNNDNHAVRTVIAVTQGQIEITRIDRIFSLQSKTMIAFLSIEPYKITAIPHTQCLTILGMRPYKYYPKPLPIAKYKKDSFKRGHKEK